MNETKAGWLDAARRSALLGLVLLAGCTGKEPATPPAGAPSPPIPAALTRELIRDAQVTGVLETPVTLAGGRYEGAPVEPGAASRPSVTLWEPTILLGNLDGAPGDEGAALLSTNTGGSGEFVYLAAFALRDGKAQSIAVAPLGDRVRLFRAWIERGQVHMDVIEAAPGDPACCPTQLTRKAFALQDGKLQQLESAAVGTLSVNLLAATDWMLAEMDGQALPKEALPPTALIQYGKIAGFAGCNRYSAPLTETQAGVVKVGEVAVTGGKACDAAATALEARFLERVRQVQSYGFVAGRLVLSAPVKDGTPRTLTFTR
ncbi:MAG TPA: META domain-containing protein [Steroidobacteraceae bacterium]